MRTLTTDLASLATHACLPTAWKCWIVMVLVMGLVNGASSALSSLRIGLKQNALLMCSTPDPMTPHYVVWHKGHQSVKLLGPRFYVNSKSGSLAITSVQLEDEGNFTCSAGFGVRFEPYTVTMLVSIPAKIKVTSSNPVMPHTGERLTLTCKATGKPLPSVAWYTNKQAVIKGALTEEGSRFSIEERQPSLDPGVKESILVIFPVLAEDRGSFTCIATNHVGSSHDTAMVDVQRKPTMHFPDRDLLVYWWEGHKTNLTCQSEGNPAPVIVWSSLQDTTGDTPHLALSPIVDVKNGVLVSSSIWLPLDETFHLPAMFECQSENRYGKTPKWKFTVKKGYIPLAPIVHVMRIRDDEMVLSISMPWQEDTPPISYIMAQYRLQESFREMEDSTSFNGNGTVFKLRGIMLSYRYVIKVKAVNSIGESEATVLNIYSEVRTFTLPPGPTVSPDTQTGADTESSQGNTTWKDEESNEDDDDDITTRDPNSSADQNVDEDDDDGRTLQSQGGNNSPTLAPTPWIVAVISLSRCVLKSLQVS